MFETLILGAGPAGTGSLVWAARTGMLDAWLERGVAIIDRRRRMGGGIGRYALNADTSAGAFLECIAGDQPLAALRETEAARALAACGDVAPPLSLVGRFLETLGARIEAEFAAHRASRFLAGATVQALHVGDDAVTAELTDADGRRRSLHGRSAVLALGGRRATQTVLPHGLDLRPWQHKVVAADRVLAQGGPWLAAMHLRRSGRPPLAVILGGAHSAFSAAWMLLERTPVRFAEAGVRLLYRSEPRVFYPSSAAAAADLYCFSLADVCPATGRVHRLGGLRGDGREVWRRLHFRPGTLPEPRAQVGPLAGIDPPALRRLLDRADLIVPAFGYRLATVPLFGADGRPLRLARHGPAVDRRARLLAADGAAVPHVFGVGLGSGFVPEGAMGGEASFRGQQNSLWLYQNGLGKLIHDGARDAGLREAGLRESGMRECGPRARMAGAGYLQLAR